jgi:hypothetical protein
LNDERDFLYLSAKGGLLCYLPRLIGNRAYNPILNDDSLCDFFLGMYSHLFLVIFRFIFLEFSTMAEKVSPHKHINLATNDVNRVEAPVTWKAYMMCALATFGGILYGYDSGYINGVSGSSLFIEAVEGAGASALSSSHQSLIVSTFLVELSLVSLTIVLTFI